MTKIRVEYNVKCTDVLEVEDPTNFIDSLNEQIIFDVVTVMAQEGLALFTGEVVQVFQDEELVLDQEINHTNGQLPNSN